MENENLCKKENRPLKTLKMSLNFVSSKALQMILKINHCSVNIIAMNQYYDEVNYFQSHCGFVRGRDPGGPGSLGSPIISALTGFRGNGERERERAREQ